MDSQALRKAVISFVTDTAVWMAALVLLSLLDDSRSFTEIFLSPVNLVLMAAAVIGGSIYVYVNEARSHRRSSGKSRARKR